MVRDSTTVVIGQSSRSCEVDASRRVAWTDTGSQEWTIIFAGAVNYNFIAGGRARQLEVIFHRVQCRDVAMSNDRRRVYVS